uniref:Uncharacterized protein n=1 Tax=Eutreptiella gymnastica TaxID=73025 RepID=A0A7S4G1T7_9EUGL
MCDLLSYLEVTIPDAPQPCTTKSGDYTFFKPKLSLQQSSQESCPNSKRPAAAWAPNDKEIVRKYGADGLPVDYEIHDALVPSNFAWNMSQAQRKKAAAKAEKAQAQAAAQAKTAVENGWEQEMLREADRRKSYDMAQLKQHQQECERLRQWAHEEDTRRRQQEKRDADREFARVCAEAHEDRAYHRQRAADVAAYIAKERAFKEERAQQQQEDSKRPYLTSLPMPRYEVSDEQIAANRQRQMDYWKQQIEDRLAQKREDKAHAVASEQRIQHLIESETSQVNKAQQEYKAMQRAEAFQYYEMLQSAKAERLERQEAAKRQTSEAQRALKQAQRAEREFIRTETQRRARHRNAELRRQIQMNADVRETRRRMEHEQDVRRQSAVESVPRKVLLRCPVTGLLLTPDCFNIVSKIST